MQKILVSWTYIANVCAYVYHLSAYAVTKHGVTLAVLGMSQEFKSDGIAVNALWPRTGKQLATLCT